MWQIYTKTNSISSKACRIANALTNFNFKDEQKHELLKYETKQKLSVKQKHGYLNCPKTSRIVEILL
jgi:hypothetical protein